MKYNFKLVDNIVTCFKIGKAKYAPGTLGSLTAFPIFFLIYLFNSVSFKNSISFYIILSIVILILFFVGTKFSKIYMLENNKHDPSEIVIDEAVGQLLVLLLILPLNQKFIILGNYKILFWYFIIGPFILFRIFDIIKPWPINWFDKNIKGGFGVMIDDVVAAIFAVIIYYNLYIF